MYRFTYLISRSPAFNDKVLHYPLTRCQPFSGPHYTGSLSPQLVLLFPLPLTWYLQFNKQIITCWKQNVLTKKKQLLPGSQNIFELNTELLTTLTSLVFPQHDIFVQVKSYVTWFLVSIFSQVLLCFLYSLLVYLNVLLGDSQDLVKLFAVHFQFLQQLCPLIL